MVFGKGAGHQTWLWEFDPGLWHGRMREPTPTSCSMTSRCMGTSSFESLPSWLKVREFKPSVVPQGHITGSLTKGVASGRFFFFFFCSNNRMFYLGCGY